MRSGILSLRSIIAGRTYSGVVSLILCIRIEGSLSWEVFYLQIKYIL